MTTRKCIKIKVHCICTIFSPVGTFGIELDAGQNGAVTLFFIKFHFSQKARKFQVKRAGRLERPRKSDQAMRTLPLELCPFSILRRRHGPVAIPKKRKEITHFNWPSRGTRPCGRSAIDKFSPVTRFCDKEITTRNVIHIRRFSSVERSRNSDFFFLRVRMSTKLEWPGCTRRELVERV